MQNQKWTNTLFWVTLLTIGLAFIESAVVVYLRELYYPYGFSFPMAPMRGSLFLVEIGREASTLLILTAIGFIAGHNGRQRFAYYLYAFGIWDIFYYIFLKLILNWPASFLTWDVLFLIPTTWVSPVLAPVLLSLTMIGFTIMILIYEDKEEQVQLPGWPIALLIFGSLILITSFIWDYSAYIMHYLSWQELFNPVSTKLVTSVAYNYIPKNYMWWMFMLGEAAVLAGIYLSWVRRREAVTG